MRGMVALAVGAILAGSIPAGAQGRRVTVRRAAPAARAVRLPNHTIKYVRPARPPVRVLRVPATARKGRMTPRPPVVRSTPVSPASVPTFPVNPTVNTLGGTPIPLGQLLNPAPGLGFDFTHLAAINRDLATRAVIDPLTQHQLAVIERLPRVQPIGFFGGFGGYAEPIVVAPAQPQVIVVQQPVPQTAPATQAAPAPAAPPQAAAPPAPPLPDVGQFLLVRRDGKVIHATAFSVEGKNIVYITAEGLRRSIPIDQINTHLTEQRNAERGTILHLND